MNSLSIFTDGGSRGNPGLGACAFVVQNTMGEIIFKQGKYLGICTNNEAEYQGVLSAYTWIIEKEKELEINEINFFLDSELVVKQIKGIYKMKSPNLIPLLQKVKEFEKRVNIKISYANVPREQNALADKLVNETLDEKKN